MPRGARLDAPGALHHVMVRGIDRTAIVFDDEDRLDFLSRIGKAAEKTGTLIYAWALMTNHVGRGIRDVVPLLQILNARDTEYVLHQFARTTGTARKAYVEFVQDQMHLGSQPELTGGGLVRSAGGWSEVVSIRKRGERQFSDERILGSGEFVEEVLGEAGEAQKEMVPMGCVMPMPTRCSNGLVLKRAYRW